MRIKVYHISHTKNRESITENGLMSKEKTTGRIQYGPRLFVSKDRHDLGFDFVNFEYVDCWEFQVEKRMLKKDPFSSSKNHFFIEGDIPAEQLKLFASY